MTMAKPNASHETVLHHRTRDRAHTDELAGSLTDLIDVLQRQAFTRRFVPQTEVSTLERDLSASSRTTAVPSRGGSSG